jgi:hypothetical protein
MLPARISVPGWPNCSPSTMRPTARFSKPFPRSWPAVRARGDAAVMEYTPASTACPWPTWPRWNCRRPICRPQGQVAVAVGTGPATGRRAGAGLSREAAPGILDLHRSRRHRAGPAGHRAGSRRPVRARRQGGLSLLGADERDPAKVAGVKELIMVVPTPDGARNDLVLAAAAVAGVDRVFTIGGAQAVAALAYGTETDSAGRQDRRSRQRLRRRSQAPGVRHRRHRHDRRALRNPGDLRRQDRPGLDRDGPVLPGRTRRAGAVHPDQPRRRPSWTPCRPASTSCCPPCPAATSSPTSMGNRGG